MEGPTVSQFLSIRYHQVSHSNGPPHYITHYSLSVHCVCHLTRQASANMYIRLYSSVLNCANINNY